MQNQPVVRGVAERGGGLLFEDLLDGGGGEPFDVALDFYVNPDHVGVFTAIDRGYFDDAGLDVRTQVPSDPSAPIKQVAAGRVDLAISYEPEVFLARDKGAKVVSVAAIVQRPLTSIMSLSDTQRATLKELKMTLHVFREDELDAFTAGGFTPLKHWAKT